MVLKDSYRDTWLYVYVQLASNSYQNQEIKREYFGVKLSATTKKTKIDWKTEF